MISWKPKIILPLTPVSEGLGWHGAKQGARGHLMKWMADVKALSESTLLSVILVMTVLYRDYRVLHYETKILWDERAVELRIELSEQSWSKLPLRDVNMAMEEVHRARQHGTRL